MDTVELKNFMVYTFCRYKISWSTYLAHVVDHENLLHQNWQISKITKNRDHEKFGAIRYMHIHNIIMLIRW